MAKDELLLGKLKEYKRLGVTCYSFGDECPTDALVEVLSHFIIENKLKLNGLILTYGNIGPKSLPWLIKLKDHVESLNISNNHLGADAVKKLQSVGFIKLVTDGNTLNSKKKGQKKLNFFGNLCGWTTFLFCQKSKKKVSLHEPDENIGNDFDTNKTLGNDFR